MSAHRHCIGVDLDNTLVCYDPVFARIAAQRGIVVGEGVSPKKALRDALRRQPDGEAQWTRLQGEAYGPGMSSARPYPGAREAIERWVQAGHEVVIISHKSRFPALGPAHDLHAHARRWIDRWFGDLDLGVFLELTRWLKLRRIESERCEVFVDDLLDVLEEPTFPRGVRRVWFTPEAAGPNGLCADGPVRAASWSDVDAHIHAHQPWSYSTARLGSPTRRTGAFVGDPEEFFSAFVARELGSNLCRCTPLAGGINNLGARLLLADGREVVGKIYKRSPADPRDRLRHETQFLRLLESAGIDCVPRVLAVDEDAGAALHSLVPGERWPDDKPAPTAIWEQFSVFLERLRAAARLPDAAGIPLAAEAAMTLQEHLAWVQERRDRWRAEALDGRIPMEFASRLEQLDVECETLSRDTIAYPDFQRAVDRTTLVLTPSDFGLHNALVASNGCVSFVDFEYAGWDDPLKTEIDFAHQPRHAVGRPDRLRCFDGLVDRANPRARAVRALLALKWRYIILAADVARARSALPAPVEVNP